MSGFLTKVDMRRLETELPLSAEQLEQVFDSLDENANGFLTKSEFASGFGNNLFIYLFIYLFQPSVL